MVFVFKVSSLFEQSSRRHVKDMAHYIVMYEEIVDQGKTDDDEASGHTQRGGGGEGSFANDGNDHSKEHYEQKRKVRRPVPIADFFKPRSFEKGTPKKEIRKVLLYGNPGSGKTCVSKLIAHRWALGEIMQEFKTVYLVPFRELNAKLRGLQGGTLEDVVANMCFKKASNNGLKDSRTQVKDDLAESTTLLIFDGLDEAGDEARDLLLEAEKHQCKLLVLTRPYNLREIQTRMDFKVECIGFNDRQLEEFINGELLKDKAVKLIESLQQNRALWEMACIPVTACILCSFAKNQEAVAQGQRNLISMYQMYNGMTDFVWKRFEEKPEAGKAKKKDIFDDLEKIAYEALRAGQILIEERIVQHHATTTNAPTFFKNSGFLLLKLEGQEYQFPHLTFQEYFAARYVARCLREKVPNEEKKVRDFIDRGKYDEKNALTMSFTMHAIAADGQDVDALHDILSIFDGQSVEVLGMQHFFLRMRALEATLEEARGRDVLDLLLRDEKANKIAEGARHLVKSTVDNAAIREIVVENLERCLRVLEYFPKILKDTVEKTKEELVSDKSLQENDTSRIQYVLKLAKHSDTHINDIVQDLSHEMNKVEDRDSAKDIIWRLGLVAEEAPYVAGKLVPVLKKGCDDVHANVRESAMVCIGKLAMVAPHLANSLLPMLMKGSNDKSLQVRKALPEAIGRFVKEAPHLAADLIPMLETLYDDESQRVRRNIMDAIAGITEALPQFVDKVLPLLKKGCNDGNHQVRVSAMKTIAKVTGTSTNPEDELLSLLETGCSDEHYWVRTNVMESIKALDFSGSPHIAEKFVPMVEKGYKDKDTDVRKNAMEAIGTIIGGSPRLGKDDLLKMLKEGCLDNDPEVSKSAVDTIGAVIEKSSDLVTVLLDTLKRACAHEQYLVRANAMNTIGKVVWALPHLVDLLLSMLNDGWIEDNTWVRANAMEAIGKVVKAFPFRARALLPMVMTGCDRDEPEVRRSALEAVGMIAYAAPDLVDELVPLLETHSADTDVQVRKNVIGAVGIIIGVSKPHAENMSRMLETLSADIDVRVRTNVIEAIGEVIEKMPQFADKLLAMVARRCSDADFKVCDIARKILDGLEPKKVIFVTMQFLREHEKGHALIFVRYPITLDRPTTGNEAFFVLHTTSSQEIWKSDKAVIDEYIKSLKREFEDNFPGLLEHFNTEVE